MIFGLFIQSVSLKPAVATRPSIQTGPKTNLRVAAILEKANTIRQVRRLSFLHLIFTLCGPHVKAFLDQIQYQLVFSMAHTSENT